MRRAVAAFVLGALSLSCGGPAARSGPRTYWAPASPEAPPDAPAANAIGFAEMQVGKRYCWGGTGPTCFDCSGLIQAAWRSGGVRLPRTSDAQGRALVEVPIAETRPGDILWWPGHVGLYVGGGAMIDAYHSGAGVVRRRAVVPERVLRAVPTTATATATGW
jgi:peptidoglycan DL-endopeptidase CwlO